MHTILDVHYRAHHIFLNVHCMLFMLWWAVKETGENLVCVHITAEVLHTSGFAFMMDTVPLTCEKLSFSTVQDCLRGLEMYHT